MMLGNSLHPLFQTPAAGFEQFQDKSEKDD
jgi:hypothetical protein